MLLFDIVYHGCGYDRSVPLPQKAPRGVKYAVCKNGAPTYYIPCGEGWLQVAEQVAKKHARQKSRGKS